MRILLAALLVCVAPWLLCGAPEELNFKQAPLMLGTVKTRAGKTYADCAVIRMSHERVSIRHREGMVILPSTDLTEETRAQLPFNQLRLPPAPLSIEDSATLIDSAKMLNVTRWAEEDPTGNMYNMRLSLGKETGRACVQFSYVAKDKTRQIFVYAEELVDLRRAFVKYKEWHTAAVKEGMPAVSRTLAEIDGQRINFYHTEGRSYLGFGTDVFTQVAVEKFAGLLDEYPSASDEMLEKLAGVTKALSLK